MTDGRTDRAALINSSLETKKRLFFIANLSPKLSPNLSPNLSFNWAEMVFNLDLPHPPVNIETTNFTSLPVTVALPAHNANLKFQIPSVSSDQV